MEADRTVEVRRIDTGWFVRPASETGTGTAHVEAVSAYVVVGAGPTVLFDTGIGAVDAETEAHYRPRRRELRSALADAGIGPDDVDVVVNSHLHFDHCGGNARFAGRPVVVQAAELEAARAVGYTIPELVDIPGVRYEIVSGDVELAPGLVVMATPGHSPGHQSLVVRAGDGTVVVAGQATDTASAWATLALTASLRGGAAGGPDAAAEVPPEVPDPPAWFAAVTQLDPRRVVFAHDGAVWVP